MSGAGGPTGGMMDTANFTPDQVELRDAIRSFVDAELMPHADAIDRDNGWDDLRVCAHACRLCLGPPR